MRRLRSDDITKLAYIHSSRTISLNGFHKVFYTDMTKQAAHHLLKYYVDNGLLFSTQFRALMPMSWGLTKDGIIELLKARWLLSKNTHPVRINFREQEHHQNVVDLRIALESNQDFPIWEYTGKGGTFSNRVFFVSDFEMAKGISPYQKWEYLIETPHHEKDEYLFNWVKASRKKSDLLQKNLQTEGDKRQKTRTPDGFFWAVWDGQRRPFVLEYEHSPYSMARLTEVVSILKKDFSSEVVTQVDSVDGKKEEKLVDLPPIKLFVTPNENRMEFFKKQLKALLEGEKVKGQWMIAHLEDVKKLSAKSAFKIVA